jgi:hypothetical protein
MTCERCEFIEEEYVRAESEDLTRDALILALATLRIERNKLRGELKELRDAIRPSCRFCGEQKAPDKICGHCAEDL